MEHYHFVMVDNDESMETLGGMALADDNDALAFGEQVAQDLVANAGDHTGLALAVVKGKQVVARIALDRATLEKQSRHAG